MDWNNLLYPTDEKPLDRLVEGYSRTSIFRTIAFIGDSLSSGEFETRDSEGKAHYHDLYDYSWGQFIARKNGLKAYNFSKGGMTAKVYMDRAASGTRTKPVRRTSSPSASTIFTTKSGSSARSTISIPRIGATTRRPLRATTARSSADTRRSAPRQNSFSSPSPAKVARSAKRSRTQ